MIKNLTPVSTPHGDGIITDPNRHGYYRVEVPGVGSLLFTEAELTPNGDRPAWLSLPPLPVVAYDPEHEAYGHVHDRMQDNEDRFMEVA